MARCYGNYRTDSMSDVRVEVCAVKAARRKGTAAPESKMLPSTTAAYQLNVWSAHIQTAIGCRAWRQIQHRLTPCLWCFLQPHLLLQWSYWKWSTVIVPQTNLPSQHNIVVMLPYVHAQFSVCAKKNQTVRMKKQLRLQRLVLKSSICDDIHVHCPGIHWWIKSGILQT